jgi:outer membrane protein assembly factor BamB
VNPVALRCICLGIALLGGTDSANAQATFHGDATHSGHYAGPGPATFNGVQWTFKGSGPIVASPTIVDGVIFIGDYGGQFHAIDQANGKEKWNFKSRMPITSTAAVSAGSVYFVSSAGGLVALDAVTGKNRWVFATEYERRFEARNLHGYPSAAQTIPDAWDTYMSSPAVADGRVYFGSGDGNVYAIDANSGVILWKFATQDVVHASPAVSGGMVYIGSWDGNFYAIDAETGQQRWIFKGGQDPAIHNQVGFQSSAAIVDGTVYVGCRDAHVYALDAKTGRKKWDYPTNKSWVNTTPAVANGIVYAGTSDSSRFMALDAATGRLRFNFDAKAYVFSSPAIAGDIAYFGAHNGKLYAVDAKDGQLRWSFQTEASRLDPQKLLGIDGSLNREAFTPVFGDFQDMYLDFYRFMSIGSILSSPVVDHGVVYVASMDGNLYALK